jgi:hypothetical protein
MCVFPCSHLRAPGSTVPTQPSTPRGGSVHQAPTVTGGRPCARPAPRVPPTRRQGPAAPAASPAPRGAAAACSAHPRAPTRPGPCGACVGGAAQSFALHCSAAPWKEQEFSAASMLAMVPVLMFASPLCFLLRADAGGVEGVSSCLLYNTQRSSWDVANRTCYAAASGGHLLTSKQVGCSRLVWLCIL